MQLYFLVVTKSPGNHFTLLVASTICLVALASRRRVNLEVELTPGGRKWRQKLKPKLKLVPDGVPSGPRRSQMIVWSSPSHHKKTKVRLGN